MTNVIRSHTDSYNDWISFEKDGDNAEPSLELSLSQVDGSDEDVAYVTVWGRSYRDRDNYPCQDSLDLTLSMIDVIALRDFLDAQILRLGKGAD